VRPDADQSRSRPDSKLSRSRFEEVGRVTSSARRRPSASATLRALSSTWSPTGSTTLIGNARIRRPSPLGEPLVEDDAYARHWFEGEPKVLVEERPRAVDDDDGAYAGPVLEVHLIGTVGAQAMAQSPVLEREDDPHQDAAARADDEHGEFVRRSKVRARGRRLELRGDGSGRPVGPS
jgi:hypothetical protein